MKDKLYLIFIGLCIVALLAMIAIGPQMASAAPLGAPTPVTFSNNGSRAQGGARSALLFDGTPAAYQTPVTACYDMRDYSVADVEWTAAQAAAITVTLLHGADTTAAHLVVGQTLINSSSTPVATPGLQQYPLYEIQQCVKIQAANATPVGVWVHLLGK